MRGVNSLGRRGTADRIGGDVHVRHVIDDHSDPEAVAVVQESFSRPEEARQDRHGKAGIVDGLGAGHVLRK